MPPYLEKNSWEEELNFKLWVTGGARFRADKRTALMGRWSQLSVTLLTTYIIILGILPLLPKPLGAIFPADVLSFSTTAVSIILLAYSLLENSRNYALLSYRYHQCGLHIGELYARFRQAKEIKAPADKTKEIAEISIEYQRVLRSNDNHDPIDFDTFKTYKPVYFRLWRWDCWFIWIRYYFKTLFVYHCLILLPPILLMWLSKTSK